MRHVCSPACDCKVHLDAAVAALEESTRILSASMSGSTETMEFCFAMVRAAKAKTAGALAAYQDHFTESETA